MSKYVHPARLLCIVGPTASGKSDLAVDVALSWGAEIISLDASQVYRGFDIGTGKVTQAEMRGVPHHLIDCIDPDEHFDAGLFRERADALISEISAREKRVILCGGTGLYLKALLEGLCEAPKVDEDIQKRLDDRLLRGEVEQLHAELAEVDPEVAQRLQPRDKQRITRALGVYLSHGVPLGVYQAQHLKQEARYAVKILGLDPPRERLNERIAARVTSMWDAGFLHEVQQLRDRGYHQQLQSMGAIGYRLALSVLEGAITEVYARERMLFATRQYARRQRRFFDRQLDTRWITPPEGLTRITLDDVNTIIGEWWEKSE